MRGLVTTFCPPMTTGAGELVVQADGEDRFVVDCKVKPTALVGHIRMTLVAEGMMVSCAGNENGLVGMCSILMFALPVEAWVHG
jgi:hypothetical protein